MPRRLLLLIPALLVLATLGVWGYRTFASKPTNPATEVQVKTQAVAGITFEVEHEIKEGVNLFTVDGPDSIRFRRGDDVLEFDTGIVMVNEIGMPDVKAGDVVRWNLSGPLLVNGQPVQPHPLQAQVLDARNIDAEWRPLDSPYPRDTFSVAWIGTSRRLAAAHGDGAIRIWDVDKGVVVKSMIPEPPPATPEMSKEDRGRFDFRIAVSPDGKTLAAGSVHGEVVSLWDIVTGNKTESFRAPKGKVNAVGFASGVLVEARGEKLYLRIPLLDEKKRNDWSHIVELGKAPNQSSSAFAFNSDSPTLSWNDGAKVRTVLVRPLEAIVAPLPVMSIIEPASSSSCLGLSSDGSLLALFDGEKRLSIYETKTGQVQHRLRWRGKLGSDVSINALAFAPDGKTLAVGTSESVRFYDVPSGRERGGMPCPLVRSLAYSADGRTLAAGLQYQPGLRLWETSELVAKPEVSGR